MDAPTLDNLIDGYFEDRLGPDELDALTEALSRSPQARQRFWDHGHLQAYLVELAERKVGEDASHRLATEDALAILLELESLAEPPLRAVEPDPEPVVFKGPSALELAQARLGRASMRIGPLTRGLAAAAVAGIVLLLGWQLLFTTASPGQRAVQNETGGPDRTPDPAPAPAAYATLVRSFDAAWQGPAPAPGELLGRSDRYRLTRGAVELQLDTGARVTLRAPAAFAISDDNRLTLRRGRAFAAVPEAAVGFEVLTPQGSVVDLGTEFGVRVDEQGRGEVVVFKGLVKARAHHSDDEPTLIPANFGATVKAGGDVSGGLTSIDRFRTDDFARNWDEVIYHPEVVKGVYEPQAPRRLTDNATEADYIKVFPERRGVELDAPLKVLRLYASATTQITTNADTYEVQPGEKVNAFLVHLDRPGRGDGLVVRQAEITFPGEVLGVIKEHAAMLATDVLLGAPDTRYPKPGEPTFRSSVDPFNSDRVDTVRLDPDGRTLTVSFFTTNVDAIRVIVRNTDDAPRQADR